MSGVRYGEDSRLLGHAQVFAITDEACTARGGGYGAGSARGLGLLPGVDAVAVAAGGGAELKLGVQAGGAGSCDELEQLRTEGYGLITSRWNVGPRNILTCRGLGDQVGGHAGTLGAALELGGQGQRWLAERHAGQDGPGHPVR